MRIVVAGYRAIDRADLRLAPIALVGGPNEGGKTSLCQAVAAAVTGEIIPIVNGAPLTTKGGAAALVHDGAERGIVTITGPNEDAGDLVSVVWPACERHSAGRPPAASAYAAGVVRIAALAPAERAAALVELTGAVPGRGDFDAALAAAGIERDDGKMQAALDKLWGVIETDGWDAAHIRQKESGARLKGQWQEVTGVAWGVRKAAGWTPPDWPADLDAATLADLNRAAAAARAAYEERIRAVAVSEAELGLMRRQAAGRAQAEAARDELRVRLAAAEARLVEADTSRKALPDVAGESGLPCPWCGQYVRVGRGVFDEMTFERFEHAPSVEEHDRRHRAITAADDRTRAAAAEVSRTRTDLLAAEALARSAVASAERLAEFGNLDVAEAAIGDARAALAAAERRLRLWEQRARAAAIRNAIERNGRITALLAADGVRQTKLRASLAAFNTALATISAEAGWPKVVVDEEMRISRAAGRRSYPYEHLSASARWRVDLVLQLAAAAYDRSDLLVIDALDICDARHRNAVLDVIAAGGRPALVTLTCSARRVLPDLAAAGLGASYWLEDGVLVPVARPAAEAA